MSQKPAPPATGNEPVGSAAPAGGTLGPALPEYLARCRWFSGKARTILRARLVETWWLAADERRVSLNLVRVDYVHGEPETYVVPMVLVDGARAEELREHQPQSIILGVPAAGPTGQGPAVLCDAAVDPAWWQDLLGLFAPGRRLEGLGGSLTAELQPAFAALRGAPELPLAPRPCREEQSNTSVTYGDRLILKLFRRPDAGVSPEVEISRVLSARGYAHTPAFAGHLEYRPADGVPVTLAVLHRFVPNDGDAWGHARREVEAFFARVRDRRGARGGPPAAAVLAVARGGPPPVVADLVGPYADAAGLLGRRVAELHLTLAAVTDEPAFAPEPYTARGQRAAGRAMADLAAQTLLLVRRRLPELPPPARGPAQRFLRAEPLIIERLAAFGARPLTVPRIRGHGDLHLGQVLHAGGDFVIIDFEGEPARPLEERRGKHAALRDVAGMLRSFHYAAFGALEEQIASGGLTEDDRAALEPWAEAWHACVGGAFLRRYLETAAASVLVPGDEEELRLVLDTFQLEKAVYEVAYEVGNRPAWLPIPLRAVAGLV